MREKGIEEAWVSMDVYFLLLIYGFNLFYKSIVFH